MKIINDPSNKYKDEIRKHLRLHNKPYSTNKESYTKYFYVFEENKLIGKMTGSYTWNWASIGDYTFENKEVFQSLISTVQQTYKQALGLQVRTDSIRELELLKTIGFKQIGTVKGTTLVPDYYYADLTHLLKPQSYTVQVFDEELEEYKVEEDNHLYESYCYVAFIDDLFVGGIQGYIYEDTINISLLSVVKNQRGKKIGFALMNNALDLAKKRNLKMAYVGTTSFQARPFYERFGFEVVLTRKDYPMGHENYKMIKKI